MQNDADLLFEELKKVKTKQQLEYLIYEFFMKVDYKDPMLKDIIKELKEIDLDDVVNTLYMVPVHQMYKKSSPIERIGTILKLKDTEFIHELYNNIMESYKRIINNTLILSSELDVNNSLEMSILFSYLLFGGYYSQSGKHNYKIEGRTVLPGMFFYEIFKGGGVCLNYSDMLCDILNTKGYDAALLANKISKPKKIDYRIPIERCIIKPTFLTRLKMNAMSPLTSPIGNHAVTLIVEDGKPYIFDSTNLLVFECLNNKKARCLINNVSLDLKPYLSAMFNDERKMAALKTLSMTTEYKCPYDEASLVELSNKSVESFKSNENLLRDFYSDNYDDINNIVCQTQKLVRK